MIQFEQSAVINAPIEKVFACVADFKRIPEWRTDVPAITNISGETQKGTTFIEEVHFMGKKQLLMKVTEFIPAKKLSIQAESGMAMLPAQTFVFHSEGNKTKLELSVSMKTSGIFSQMEFLLKGKLKSIWASYFKNLDKLLAV